MNKDGVWSIRSEKTRSQTLNLADCLDKLRCYIQEARTQLPPPSLELLEQRRSRAEQAAARRLQSKRARSLLKREQEISVTHL